MLLPLIAIRFIPAASWAAKKYGYAAAGAACSRYLKKWQFDLAGDGLNNPLHYSLPLKSTLLILSLR